MRTILCFGDSNTWGHDPATMERLAPEVRWPGVLRKLLPQDFQVIEEALCGRTTDLDDPFEPGRNGLSYLRPCLESQAPVDLVAIMLGSNDLKSFYRREAPQVAWASAALARAVMASRTGPGQSAPRVLLLSPPHLGPFEARSSLWGFAGADVKSRALAPHVKTAAEVVGCAFFDVGAVTSASPLDGVHLDAEGHARLGRALVEPVLAALGRP